MVSFYSTIIKPTSGKAIGEVSDIVPHLDLHNHGHVVIVSYVHMIVFKDEYGAEGISNKK